MQKNKNQNKFIILLLAILFISVAIVSSIGAVSAADLYVDTSGGNYYMVDSRVVNNGLPVGSGYLSWTEYRHLATTGPNDQDNPYSTIQNAYTAAANNGDTIYIASTSSTLQSITLDNKNVNFAHWSGNGTSTKLTSISGWTNSTSLISGYYNGNHPFPTTTTIQSVNTTGGSMGTSTFTGTGGSGSDLVINNLNSSNGTQNLNGVRTNAMTTTGGNQYFYGNAYVTNNVNFYGGTPSFNGSVEFYGTNIDIAANTPDFNFNSNVIFRASTVIDNNDGDYSHNFIGVTIDGIPPGHTFTYRGLSAAEFNGCVSNIEVIYQAEQGRFINSRFNYGLTFTRAHCSYYISGCNFTKAGGTAFNNTGPNSIHFHNCNFYGSTIGIYNPYDSSTIHLPSINGRDDHCLITLDNCTLYDNGNAIINEGELNIINITRIVNNHNTSIVLRNTGGDQRTTISGSFIGNNRGINGAGISISGGLLNISSTRFYGNNASGNGGAIYQNGTTSTINLNYTNITNLGFTTSVVDFTVFDDNHAANGGAIYSVGGTINGFANFTNNRAVTNGGAIYLDGGSINFHYPQLYVWNGSNYIPSGNAYSYLAYNNATDGGALYHVSGIITGYAEYYYNNATNRGGAIFSNSSTFEISGYIYYNKATNGGGIYHDDVTGTGTLTVSGNVTRNNATGTGTTGGYGGGIYSGAKTINAGNVDYNNATTAGGGLYANNSDLTVSGNYRYNTAPNGGGIYHDVSNGTLDVSGSTVSYNYANGTTGTTDGYGGGIYSGANRILGGTISNNHAYYAGGGLYANNTTLIVTGTYSDNTARIKGGGIYHDVSNGSIDLTDANIRNNCANGTNGGGLHTGANNITGGTFTGNTADRYGGGIYANNSNVSVRHVYLERNRAYNGGGIYHDGDEILNVTNCTLIENNATNNGGGIYSNTSSEVLISNSSLIRNHATVNGGGVFYGNGADDTYLNITNRTVLSGNTAGIDGGGVWTNASNVIINESSLFDGNKANTGNGGGIYHVDRGNNASLNISNSTFRNNVAHLYGGGIWTNITNVTVANALFDGNNATTYDGGGIYYTANGTFNVSETIFSYNTAGQNGGGIFTNTSEFYVTDSVFNYNGALNVNGGGIHYDNPTGKFNVTNLTFNGNHANNGRGGGVYTNVDEFNVTDSRFNGNSAVYGGGIYYYDGNRTDITNTSFTNNRASDSGGALWTNNSQVDIDNSNFVGNTAGLYGGAIYQDNTTGYLNITSSYLAYNYAAVDGGAINTNADLTKVHNTTLLGNIAGHYGGAYYNVNPASTLEITNSTLNNNRASQGGAVYTSGKSTWIHGSTLSGNYAYNTGGAVFQTGSGYLTISHSVLDNNAAFYSGGAVYTSVGTTIEDSSLSNNVAELFYGGGVCNEGPELRVFRTNFTNNAAMLLGAAIYNYQHGRTVVVDSRFLNNHGVITSNRHDYGLVDVGDAVGAIGNRGQLEVTNGYFSGNALGIADHGHMFVTQSLFENNIWAILMAGAGSQVFSNTFLNNNLAFNVTGKDNVIIYNRVVVPFMGKGLMNSGVNTFANLNWWGQNDINSIVQGIILDNWFIMYLTNDEKLNFVNPGDWLSYTYHFELNTKEPCNLDYLPYFTVTVSHNGINETFRAIETRSWYVPFSTTDFYFVSATLDNEFATFNVNNYSTNIKIGNYDAKVGDTVILTATLTDAYGTPLINHRVEFRIDNVLIGVAYTDLDGVARLSYKATKAGTNYLSAYYAGGSYTPSYFARGLTGSGFYKPSSMSTSILYVTTGTADLIGKFTSGNTTANKVNTSVIVGSNFTFRYTLTNLDAGQADLVVKFKIPTGLKFVNAVVGGLKFNAPENRWVFDKKTNTLTFYIKLGNRTSFKNSISIDITLTAAKVGKYTITPTITSNNTKVKASAGSITIDVKPKSAVKKKVSDLIITKVKKVNGGYKITVKNKGTATAKGSFLQLICGCKKYSKLANVKSLASGKSTTLTVKFPTKGMGHVKYAKVNYNKKVVESNYKNNVYKLGKM